MKYKILLQQSEEGFSVSCPGLPGCWSQGATEQEAIENIRDAIQEYLAAIAESLKDADVREIEVSVEACENSPGSIICKPLGLWRRRAPDRASGQAYRHV